VTTLLQSIRQISPGLGILLGGLLAAAGSSRLAFAVAGGGCLLFAGATFVLTAPKRLGDVPGGGDPLAPPLPTDPGTPIDPATPLSGQARAALAPPDVVASEPTSSSKMTIKR
jgi:hypothetical protein